MTTITTNNYFSTINDVDLSTAPEALRNGHGLFVRATNEGKNMQAYQSNETIKRVVDTYIEKLNAWISGQQKQKDDKRILIVRPGASQSKTDADAAKKAAEADMKAAAAAENKKETPAEMKKKKHHATQNKRKTGRKAYPKSTKPFPLNKEKFIKWFRDFKQKYRKMFDSTWQFNQLIDHLSNDEGITLGELKNKSKFPSSIVEEAYKWRSNFVFFTIINSKSTEDGEPYIYEPKKEPETKPAPKAAHTPKPKKQAKAKEPKVKEPDNRTKVEKVPTSVSYINRYRLMNGKTLPKEGRGSVLSLLNSLQKAIEEKLIRKDDKYASEITTIQKELVNLVNSWKGNKAAKIEITGYDNYMTIVRAYVVAPLTMLIKRFIKIQGKGNVKTEAANLIKAIDKHIEQKEITKPDVADMLVSLNNYAEGKTDTIQISTHALNGLKGLAGYRWKPSKAQRREFANKMQDPAEKAAYLERLANRAAKRRAGSKFDYDTAGGYYIPTKLQNDAAFNALETLSLTADQKAACNDVINGYFNKQKVHHDSIHVVNELIRSNPSLSGMEMMIEPDPSIVIGDKVETPLRIKGTLRKISGSLAFIETDKGKTVTCPAKYLKKASHTLNGPDVVNSCDLKDMEFHRIGLTGKYAGIIGDPSEPWSMMIYGAPGSGKSTCSIEFAHVLASELNRKVAYVAKEEGIGYTIQEKFGRLNAYHQNIDIYSNRLPEHPENYNYIIIDSVNEFGIEYDELSKMQHDWRSRGINPIYVFKGTKDGSFRGSQEFEHLVDVSLKVEGGIVRTEKSRFGGKGALVVYSDESQTIPKFSELTKAEGYRNKEKSKMYITKGEDGKYWVVNPAQAELMKAQGFEVF